MKDFLRITFTAPARIAAIAIMVITIAIAVAGCNNNDRILRVEPASIVVPAEEVTEMIEVFIETSAAWMAYMSDETWLSFEFDEDRSDMVWVRVLSTNESLETLTARLTIIAGNGQSVVVPITRSAMNVTLDVTPAALEPFSGNGLATQTLTVETDKTWEVFSADGANWLNFTRSDDGLGNILTVGVDPSRSFNTRNDIIVVRHINEEFASLADSIPVVQNGVKLLASTENAPDSYEINMPAGGGKVGMTVSAIANWTVSTTASGVTFDPAGGVGDLAGEEIWVTIPANTSTETIVFTIVFECEGEPYEYTFTQEGEPEPEPEPEPDPDEQNPPVQEP